jgi:hypothetical protein
MAGVRTAEDRSERLYGAAETILERALRAKDLRTALQAIKAAVDVMREGRGYLELRGELTGELNRSQPPADGQKMLIQVISIPKLPGVEDDSHPPDESMLQKVLDIHPTVDSEY